MKTRYIVTTTNPDDVDPESHECDLENCQTFSNRRAAEAEYESFITRTNADVYLLQVKKIKSGRGKL